MSVTLCEPPSKRVSGRAPRLSEEDINDLKEGILNKSWVTDNEVVPTKSAAYQRAQSARDLVLEVLGDEYKVDHLKTAVEPVSVTDLTKDQIDLLTKATNVADMTKTTITVHHKDTDGREYTEVQDHVYVWKIGPRPEGERPRRRPTKKSAPAN